MWRLAILKRMDKILVSMHHVCLALRSFCYLKFMKLLVSLELYYHFHLLDICG